METLENKLKDTTAIAAKCDNKLFNIPANIAFGTIGSQGPQGAIGIAGVAGPNVEELAEQAAVKIDRRSAVKATREKREVA